MGWRGNNGDERNSKKVEGIRQFQVLLGAASFPYTCGLKLLGIFLPLKAAKHSRHTIFVWLLKQTHLSIFVRLCITPAPGFWIISFGTTSPFFLSITATSKPPWDPNLFIAKFHWQTVPENMLMWKTDNAQQAAKSASCLPPPNIPLLQKTNLNNKDER